MGTFNRYSAASRLFAASVALGAAACSDDDHTVICAGGSCAGSGGSGVDGGAGAGPIGAPCEVAFVGPLLGDDGLLRLGPEDDVDGAACGEQFSAPFSVATNASSLNFFINDNPFGPHTVSSETMEVDVPLGNRGATANTLRVRAQMPDGTSCEAEFEGDIVVDCQGPSCTIASPVPAQADYLNASQDQDALTAGLQTDVEVQSEGEHVGQAVRLMLDDTFLSDGEELVASGSEALATFADLTLAEGAHEVQAECRDALGNVTLSPTALWNVDVTPCALSVSDIAGGANPITVSDDLDTNAAGFQVLIEGEVSGAGCEVVRVGECGQAPSAIAISGAGAFSGPVTLAAATASVSVCADVVDEADNASAPVTRNVDVRSDAPVVDIVVPSNGATFNVASGCTTNVEANCSEEGVDVALTIDGSAAGTATCTGGSVTFSGVALTSKDDGATTQIAVAQTADGLTSPAESVDVQADCNAPVLSFTAPICGGQLSIATDDVDGLTAGLQFDVVVANGGVPDVDLTVTRGASSSESSASGDATSTTFVSADLGGTGDIELTACATDPQGNQGCTSACAVSIVDAPAVSITSPTEGAVISTSTADCDAVAAGLQLEVQGTTSAVDGSNVEVTLGAAATGPASVTGGAWTACIEVVDGDNQTLTAGVTDNGTSQLGTATITLSVDLTPSGPIAAPTFLVTGRRQGTVDLSWESVLDSDGDPLAAYQLRCAATDIVDETTWGAATEIPVTVTPAATAGQTETESLTGIKTGTSRFCAVRGEDSAGNLSAISAGSSATVSNPFLSQEYTIVDDPNVAAAQVRIAVDPIGDINGDGVADFIYGSTQRVAQVFFGKTSIGANATESPDVTFTFNGSTTNTVGFGSEVAGLGDINGDTLPDFAIGAPGANAVFVFFGRSSLTPWPALVDVNANSADGCEADLCILGSGLFGWDVHSGNVDSVGPNDLVIAARTANTNGQVFILLGGAQLDVTGSTITVDNTTLSNNVDGFVASGAATSPNFGFSVGSVGAGLNDVVIGANGVGTGGTEGAVYVLPAQTAPAAGTGLTDVTSALQQVDTGAIANFGAAVRALGDYDGDGFGELATGELFNAGGQASVYLGSASGFSNTSTLTFANDLAPAVDDNYGSFIAAGVRPDLGLLGDLDGDGLSEIAIGSTTPDTPSTLGTAQLFYGATGALGRGRASADMTYTSKLIDGQVIPNFVGDINDDGFNDLVMLDSGPGVNVLFLLY